MTSVLYPGSYQYPAMLYSKAPKKEKLFAELESKKYIAQPKKDGAFYQLEKTKDGEVYLFSRSVSKKTGELSQKIDNVPHLKEWAKELPNDTILIGEIYYPGKKSNDTTKVMGALSRKAIERQEEWGKIHYYIHDIIRYDGQNYIDTPFEKRYSLLCEKIDIGLYCPSWIEIASSLTGCGMYERILNWIDSGEEGAVIKLKSGLYMPGKRPVYNFKIKEEQNDIDLIITATIDPVKEYSGTELESWPYWEEDCPVTKAYYYGWKGSIEVSGYKDGSLIPVGTVSSGLTDEMKKDMAENPDEYIGEVCELQAMSWTKDGALRHPRFVRMRPDKNPAECIL